jgi:hypothetical protein
MNESQYPAGWDAKRVKEVLDHYENQSEDDAITEDKAAYEATTHTVMCIPIDLVPQVRNLLANNPG